MKFKLQPYNLQELGQRDNQEDALFPGIGQLRPQDRLFILCDGMGGHEKGEVASQTVCATMSDYILNNWDTTKPLEDELFNKALAEAYDALDAKDDGAEKKMGTTMTFLCFHAGGATIAHIGDSRVYQIRPEEGVVFKTRDHSLVNDLVRIGEITEEEAKTHPQKNVITRAMQPCQERRAKADIKLLTDVKPGDYFYMCSDGMLEQTEDEDLVKIITNPNWAESKKVEVLRNVTEDNHDNHTAHLIKVEAVEGAPVVVEKPVVTEEHTQLPPAVPAAATVAAPRPAQAQRTAQPAAPQKQETLMDKLTDPRNLLKVLIAVLVVAAAVVLGFYLMNKDKDAKKANQLERKFEQQYGNGQQDGEAVQEDNSVEYEPGNASVAPQNNNGKKVKAKENTPPAIPANNHEKEKPTVPKAKPNAAPTGTPSQGNPAASNAKKEAAKILKENGAKGADKPTESKSADSKANETPSSPASASGGTNDL